MNRSSYQFSQPKIPQKNSLQRKLDWTKVGIKDDEFVLPSFPPKSLKQIVALIDANQSSEISIFEWLNIVEDSQQWEALTEDVRYDACRAIWQEIIQNNDVGDIVFFRIAQQFDDDVVRVVTYLTSTMKVARSAKHLSRYTKSKIDWLISLQEKDYHALARTCFSLEVPIRTYLTESNLPISNQYQFAINRHLVAVAFNEYTDIKQLDEWLVRCINQEKATSPKVELISLVLENIKENTLINKTKQLIESVCLPFSENTLWYEFREQTKEKLRSLFDLSSYYSLESVSRFLCNHKIKDALALTDDEVEQIRDRNKFWSNYTGHFIRIRVLFPYQTKVLFDDYNGSSVSFVSVLTENDKDDSCEVYIFEFEKLIVVEMLRGSINEIRLFKNNDWNAQRLFEPNSLSLDEIRSLSHLEIHDHVIGWQYFCESLLRNTYHIKPDNNVVSFKGLPPESNRYSFKTGLPKPKSEILNERAEKLEQWVEMFWAREFKTGKYGDQKGLQLKSNLYLSKAMVEKQCGNQTKYEEYIHKAANQGNSEAMWLLGVIKLKARNGEAKSRQYGEEWIRKAAHSGHKEAIAAAERYGLV